jgi:hypothetical protein
MKKVLIIFLALLGVGLLVAMWQSSNRTNERRPPQSSGSQQQANVGPTPRVPAHYEEVKSLNNLPPTLAPEQFFGQARMAYQVAREIPQTLAQLPCYCYCDQTFGHKSLHSCYESDHSAHCAVCVNEALLAYRLQKDFGLTAPQVRERIIAEFSKQ